MKYMLCFNNRLYTDRCEHRTFQESFKSEFTKIAYNCYLKKYGLDKLSITDPKLVENEIIQFVLDNKKKGKSSTAIGNYVKRG